MSTKEKNTTMSNDKLWFTTRIRVSTKNELVKLAGTRLNKIGNESYDDVIRRLITSHKNMHNYMIDIIYPINGEKPSNEDYLAYYLSTTEEKRMADALEARKRKEEYYTNLNKDIGEQDNINEKDYKEFLQRKEPTLETLFSVTKPVKVI